MTITAKGGINTYSIAISTAIAGGGTGPDGDTIYINANKVSPSFTLKTKIEHLPASQSFSLKDAQRFWKITLSNCAIRRDISGTYTDALNEFNAISQFIDDSCDLNESPLYLTIANSPLNGSYTTAKFKDNTGTYRNYLRGYITSFAPELEAKVNYIIGTIVFEECWI